MIPCVNFTFTVSFLTHGAVAQLGERMNGIHEARGSIPLSSTKIIKGLADFQLIPFSLGPGPWGPFFRDGRISLATYAR
jgi:hypothetical protein